MLSNLFHNAASMSCQQLSCQRTLQVSMLHQKAANGGQHAPRERLGFFALCVVCLAAAITAQTNI
jgi:hypothetical protein